MASALMLESDWLSQCDPFPMEQDHRRVKQRVRLMLGAKRLDYAAVSLAGIELIPLFFPIRSDARSCDWAVPQPR
jgi:hypothetical protein